MELKRVGPFSAFKVGGALYGLLGLVFGAFITVFSLIGAGFSGLAGSEGVEEAMVGALFGIGAVIVLPIFYGLMGAVMAAFMAWVYNLAAGLFGGLEVELE